MISMLFNSGAYLGSHSRVSEGEPVGTSHAADRREADPAPVCGQNPGVLVMLGIPIRYLLRHPVIFVADLAADPVEVFMTVHDAYVAQREQRGPR
jgi:hypothetical protein